jgi:trans-aconitate methyltransferase
MPDEATLTSYYPSDYHSFDANSIMTKIKHRQRMNKLRPHLPGEAFTFLDYGCGGGAFLNFLADHFPKAHFIGFEIAPAFEIHEAAEGRIKIINGQFEDRGGHVIFRSPRRLLFILDALESFGRYQIFVHQNDDTQFGFGFEFHNGIR